ncbi:ABC transporter permease [Actinophytocola sp.]|uniref:ABC transporter permease n=1 Tax=Actinophytocola sp. TaxID=1872138 RepID=UPI003D6A5240
MRLRRAGLHALLVIFVLACWEGYVRSGLGRAIVVSRPSDVLPEMMTIGRDPESWQAIGTTALGVGVGMGLGLVIGVVAAVTLSRSELVRRAIDPVLMAFYTVPRLALIPLFIVWFGTGLASSIVVVFSQAVIVFLLSTYASLDNVDDASASSMRLMGARPWMLLRCLYVPNALPFLFSAFRQALALGLGAAIIAEMFGTLGGVGARMAVALARFDMTEVLGWVIVTALLALVLDIVSSLLEKRMIRWR